MLASLSTTKHSGTRAEFSIAAVCAGVDVFDDSAGFALISANFQAPIDGISLTLV
jgi:hypothetical protein